MATILDFHSTLLANRNLAIDKDESSPKRGLVVLLSEVEVSGTGEFLRFLESFRPKVMFDLRVSPRLDYIGGSRLRAFRVFDELSLQYVDVLGRLGVNSFNELCLLNPEDENKPTLLSWMDGDNNDNRPIVFLYNDEEVAKRCKRYFNDEIQQYQACHPRPQVSHFRSGLLVLQK